MTMHVQKTGKRRALPEDVVNDDLIRAYDASGVRHSRMEIRNKLKWLRPVLNRQFQLPLATWLLLDELIGQSHDIDWAGGPITVWPSNEIMMTWFDITERTLQIHLERLRRANFIAFIDSPSRQRWGRRDPETGRIVEAYGIDLRPFAQRVPELLALADQVQQERAETVRKRRTVRALIARVEEFIRTARKQDAANDNWQHYEDQVCSIAETVAQKHVGLAALDAALEALRPLEELIKKAIVKLFRPKTPTDSRVRPESKKESPEGESSCTHKTTTPPSSTKVESVRHSETEVVGIGDATRRRHRAVLDHLGRYKVSPALVAKACPQFAACLDKDDPDDFAWADLQLAAQRTKSILGIAPHAWKSLCSALGQDGAAVALAIVTEKFCRGARGEGPIVEKPAGYLYWIARSHLDGMELDLGPKLHALLARRSPRAA